MSPGSLHGLCVVGAARPTNGGTDGSVGPCSREITAPMLGRPDSSQAYSSWSARARDLVSGRCTEPLERIGGLERRLHRLGALAQARQRLGDLADHPADGVLGGVALADEGLALLRHDGPFEKLGVGPENIAELWAERPFPVPPDESIAPELRSQLGRYLDELGAALPVGACQVFLSCWIRIYGIVALEIYGHLHFALSDVQPMFEAELAAVARTLGVPA